MSGAVNGVPAAPDPLARVLAGCEPAFAVLYRPAVTGSESVEVFLGDVTTPGSLADLPLPEHARPDGRPHQEVLAVVPYRQIGERGFDCVDDGSPLIAMAVAEQAEIPLAVALRRIPDVDIELRESGFEQDDDTYGEIVRRVIAEEIGTGSGANFVIKRSFTAEITGYGVPTALALFRRLLERESGAYWTFVVHTGDRTFVGATPERHVSLHDGNAAMNPISGTYRYPPSGPSLSGVMEFLADRKEAEELYMVVDEELKMMSRVCSDGGRLSGPYLKEMARLAHTEYFIEGRSDRDPREILRETMFAPTVTGSPLESACRVIERFEPRGRGYYSGVAALIGRDERGERTLDSAILIRTADIAGSGRVRIDVGTTLVRHSDPMSEVAETRAKSAGLVAALEQGARGRLGVHPRVRAALRERNDPIAEFWQAGRAVSAPPEQAPSLAGRRLLVVDAEDTFTSMIEQQLRSMASQVVVRRFDEPYSFDDFDLVVMGPGPGDPRELDHPKIKHLAAGIRSLIDRRQPFLAVCLSHQVLSNRLGLPLYRREVPNQGVQREIDLFGAREHVGFYNTFSAHGRADKIEGPDGAVVELSRDPRTGELHALRTPNFASIQFHAESVLTRGGPRILGSLLRGLVR